MTKNTTTKSGIRGLNRGGARNIRNVRWVDGAENTMFDGVTTFKIVLLGETTIDGRTETVGFEAVTLRDRWVARHWRRLTRGEEEV